MQWHLNNILNASGKPCSKDGSNKEVVVSAGVMGSTCPD
jgi:hypothetical protein